MGEATNKEYSSFLNDFEGDPDDKTENSGDDSQEDSSDDYSVAAYLPDQSFAHRITAAVEANDEPQQLDAQQFMLDRYSGEVFQGITPETGVAKTSTAGLEQFYTLQREDSPVTLNRAATRAACIRFGGGEPISLVGITTMKTPFDKADFHATNTNIPFLLSDFRSDRLVDLIESINYIDFDFVLVEYVE